MKSSRRLWSAGTVALLVLVPRLCGAQAILLDKMVKAGDLSLYPDIENDKAYYYLPDQPKLAIWENGKPQFSFIKYAEQTEGREAEGGGVVHALVTFEVSEDQIREAQDELQRVRPGARIQGPVTYRSGKFGLISSFRDSAGGLSKHVVGLGNAPVLEGAKAAISILLTKEGAKLLWEEFHTATPDISFGYEMEIAGYRSPSKVKIEADWEKVYSHQAFAAAFATTFLGAEISAAYDDLRQKNAIRVIQIGTDQDLEKTFQTAYNKLMEVMFTPVAGTPSLANLSKSGDGKSLLDRATAMLAQDRQKAETQARAEAAKPGDKKIVASPDADKSKKQEPAKADTSAAAKKQEPAKAQASTGDKKQTPAKADSARKGSSLPSFRALATYELKKGKQTGQFNLDLEKYTLDRQPIPFSGNIGDLHRYLSDPTVFREANLDDPLFVQREVQVSIDGLNSSDFDKFVNFVDVQLRKKHAEGAVTESEVTIRRKDFNSQANNFKLMYGWKGDNDRRRWRDYELRRVWSFFGDRTVEQPWALFTDGQVNLRPPYQRRWVDLDADSSALAEKGVRSITVKVFYDLAGAEQIQQVTLNPAKNRLSERIEFMLPENKYDYDYEIVWHVRGNQTVSSGRKTSSESILFVDEVPQ